VTIELNDEDRNRPDLESYEVLQSTANKFVKNKESYQKEGYVLAIVKTKKVRGRSVLHKAIATYFDRHYVNGGVFIPETLSL